MPKNDIQARIARDLHDGVIQDLVAFGFSLDSVIARSDISPTARTELRKLRFQSSDLVKKLRADIFELRVDVVDIERELIEIFRDSTITFVLHGALPALPLPQAYELLKILREIALNTKRYSQADNFIIATEMGNDHINITAKDDGVGRAEEKDEHFGLQGIKERIASMGGALVMESTSDGTMVRMELPWTLFDNNYDACSGNR